MKTAFALLFATILALPASSQTNPFSIKRSNYDFNGSEVPVFALSFPYQEDLADNFSDAVKSAFGEKLSEKKGTFKSDNFSMPYTERNGKVLAWVVRKGNDSIVLKTTVQFESGDYLTASEFSVEDSLFLSVLRQFNFNNRQYYYEARIKDLQKKHKNLEKEIKDIDKDIASNKKEIKESEKLAKSNPPNKNELLGRAEDLKNKNLALEQKLAAKK